jgi:hypothetical protein
MQRGNVPEPNFELAFPPNADRYLGEFQRAQQHQLRVSGVVTRVSGSLPRYMTTSLRVSDGS